MKPPRAKCQCCSQTTLSDDAETVTVLATSDNMDTHFQNCKDMKPSLVSLLQPPQRSQDFVLAATPSDNKTSKRGSVHFSYVNSRWRFSLLGPLPLMIEYHMNTTKLNTLNRLFAKAILGAQHHSTSLIILCVSISSKDQYRRRALLHLVTLAELYSIMSTTA